MNEITPRPYRDIADLAALHSVLTAGRQAEQAGRRGSYYVHVGDLNWWLFYLNQADDPRSHLTLWEGEAGVVGWSLLSPAFRAFDVFVRPELRGTPEAAATWAWTQARLARVLAETGRADGPLRTMWVDEGDDVLIALLTGRGLARDPDHYLWGLERSLADDIPAPCLPAGFQVRPVAGEAEAAPRALAAHGAFGSQQPVEAYVERYRQFMCSPVYPGALDLVAVPHVAEGDAPPSMAAFAIAWSDPVNRVGLFEPVGTHPRFQRQGLAKAVLLDALRRLQAAGLRSAIVGVECDNPAALRLYQSVGFEPVRKIVTYEQANARDYLQMIVCGRVVADSD